jgi:hypothetical protein
MSKKLLLGFGGVCVYGAGVVVASQYMKPKPVVQNNCSCNRVTEAQRMSAYSERADSFDAELGTDETMMGLTILRRLLCRHASGKVCVFVALCLFSLDHGLFVAVGSGGWSWNST